MSELPPVPDLADIEQRCTRLWEDHGVHRFDPDGEGDAFVIDTPPPYASASHLHVGHAMSYAQAEFVARYQRMRGRRVLFPMGFDDNGLPTERYVERAHGVRGHAMPRSEFVALCLAETQAVGATYVRLWRALGLSVDWSYAYSTIDEHSRRTAQRSFVELHRSGGIVRAEEPVFWDPEMGTSLAHADLETVERDAMLHDVAFGGPAGEPLVVATTRPELLDRCVALYRNHDDPRYAHLAGAEAAVPLSDRRVPVLADGEVDPAFGTGLMMVCTFGDADDVARWRRDGLAARGASEPVRDPASAREAVLGRLREAGALAGSRRTRQRVAVSERSGVAVELVLRPQWIVRLVDQRDALLERAAALRFHPPWMRRRLDDWITGLTHDWNISRQRSYGVPFPVWFCGGCGSAMVAGERDLPVDPLEDPPPAPACPSCGSGDLRGDPDVMDTWMTSSTTPQILTNWAGTPGRPSSGELPLALRPQAHDIIRTWLFYTLVKAHLHGGTLPWTDVMVSGFGLDEQGRRISKRSLAGSSGGGRYDPSAVIERHGADALRHWAARSKLGQDTRYRERDVRAGRKVVLKLWNAGRFCAANAAGPSDVPARERRPEDRWVLDHACCAIATATGAFDAFDHAGARAAADGLLWTFTDDWLEIAKDRFRNPDRHGAETLEGARATMWEVLRTLLSLHAPFLPFVTEELYQRLYRAHEAAESLHRTAWPAVPATSPGAVPGMDEVVAILRTVRALRSAARIAQGAELAAVVVDARDPATAARLEALAPTLVAAARAREVVFGPADTSTAIDGLEAAIRL